MREFQPIAALAIGAPIDFVIHPAPHLYIVPFKSLIRLKVRIENTDTNALIVDANRVGPVNCTFHAIFSDVMVEMGGKILNENTNGLYPFRCYLETLLAGNQDYKDSVLQISLWSKDDGAHIDDTEVTHAANHNEALYKRSLPFRLGRTVELCGRPHHDLFEQRLAIPSNVGLKIRLTPAPSSFLLKNVEPDVDHPQIPYRLRILEAILCIHTLEVSAATELSHLQMLNTKNICIPIRKVELRQLTIPPHQSAANFERVLSGIMPDRLFIFFVTQQSKDGCFFRNPFNLHHRNVNHLAVYVNGELVNEEAALTPDFREDRYQYIMAYLGLYRSLSASAFGSRGGGGPCALGIPYDEYPRGFTVYGFDLSPDGTSGAVKSPLREGSLRVHVGFRDPPTETLCLIVYAERGFGSCGYELDRFGQVIFTNV